MKENFPKDYSKIRFPETTSLGVKPVSVYRINEQGSLIATNNQLDVARSGGGPIGRSRAGREPRERARR